MTAKKTPSYAERVAETKQELADALAEQTAAHNALDHARDAVQKIHQGRKTGADELSASEAAAALVQAEALVHICADDVQHADNRVATAKRGLLSDDTSVSESVVRAFSTLELFADVPRIVATAEEPNIPQQIAVPVLYVVQTEAAALDVSDTGRISAGVELILHRPRWAKPLDAEDLDELLPSAQTYVDVRSLPERPHGEVMEDRARLSVRGTWPELPVIRNPNHADQFGQTMAREAAESMGYRFRGSEFSIGSTSSRGVAGQGTARIKSVSAIGDERRTTVEATIAFRAEDRGPAAIADGFSEFLTTLRGQCSAGLGRVMSAIPTEVEGDGPTRFNTNGVKLGADVVFLSRIA